MQLKKEMNFTLILKPCLTSGVIERVVISRTGDFSCPVQCGMLFLANCNIPQWTDRPSHNQHILKGLQVLPDLLSLHVRCQTLCLQCIC